MSERWARERRFRRRGFAGRSTGCWQARRSGEAGGVGRGCGGRGGIRCRSCSSWSCWRRRRARRDGGRTRSRRRGSGGGGGGARARAERAAAARRAAEEWLGAARERMEVAERAMMSGREAELKAALGGAVGARPRAGRTARWRRRGRCADGRAGCATTPRARRRIWAVRSGSTPRGGAWSAGSCGWTVHGSEERAAASVNRRTRGRRRLGARPAAGGGGGPRARCRARRGARPRVEPRCSRAPRSRSWRGSCPKRSPTWTGCSRPAPSATTPGPARLRAPAASRSDLAAAR